MAIQTTQLHPENDQETTLYPETNWEQVKEKPTTFPTDWSNVQNKPSNLQFYSHKISIRISNVDTLRNITTGFLSKKSTPYTNISELFNSEYDFLKKAICSGGNLGTFSALVYRIDTDDIIVVREAGQGNITIPLINCEIINDNVVV